MPMRAGPVDNVGKVTQESERVEVSRGPTHPATVPSYTHGHDLPGHFL